MQKPVRITALSFVAMVVTCTGSFADEAHTMTVIPDPAAVQWGPGPANLPKGTELVVLAGDPGQPGHFVLRVKIPPNTVIAPHWHATAENLTVLSGPFYHQMGDKLDKSGGEQMAAGGFVYLPAKMNHSVWTTTAEAVVQVTGTGPFGVNYVNPTDDPSKPQ